VRFVERFNDTVSAGVSLETPQALIYNGPNPLPDETVFNSERDALFSSGNGYSLDSAPDVIGKIAFDPGLGHYEIYGIARWLRDAAAGATDTVHAGGAGGGFTLPIEPQVLDFQLSALLGKGIGRYGSAQLPDVTLNPGGQFAAVPEHQILSGLIAHPSAAWTLYGYFGEEHAYNAAFTDPSGKLGYGYGSPLYNISGCRTLGSTLCTADGGWIPQGTVGSWWEYYRAEPDSLQLGLEYSYTLRHIFPGIGALPIYGPPDVNIKMLFLSFRYYPHRN
jgi:hypothetical protein